MWYAVDRKQNRGESRKTEVYFAVRGIFSYDSALGQALSFLWDLVLLNVLFVLCALPVMTLGASWAGLYSGVRAAQDKNDGRSCVKVFFQGFKSGFPQITIGFCIFLALAVLLALSVVSSLAAGAQMQLLFSTAALLLCALLLSQMPPFHARFTCTLRQLVRNTCLITMARPLRALPSALLMLLPAAVALVYPVLFLLLLPVWFAIYFSLHACITIRLMKPPYALLEAKLSSEAAED